MKKQKKPRGKAGYREATAEEMAAINRSDGWCRRVRVYGERDVLCPNPSVPGTTLCSHHGKKKQYEVEDEEATTAKGDE